MESTAFPMLIRNYTPAAQRLAQRLLGDADAAADAVQEGLIKAYRAWDRYQGHNLRAWFLRIVTNTCFDQLDRNKRRHTLSLEALTALHGDELPIIPAASPPTPDQLLCQQETWEAVRQAVMNLTPVHRVVLQRIDIEGYSYAEVAAELQVPLGTVQSRLFRARAQMRDELVAAGLVAAAPASPAPTGCPTPNDASLTTQKNGALCT